jgi:hypothetical protein
MAEPMDVDENGVSGSATPSESITESSLHHDDTQESTDVQPTPSLFRDNGTDSEQDGSVHVHLNAGERQLTGAQMTARERDLQRRAMESSARKADYHDKHSKLDKAKVVAIRGKMLIIGHRFCKGNMLN